MEDVELPSDGIGGSEDDSIKVVRSLETEDKLVSVGNISVANTKNMVLASDSLQFMFLPDQF